MEMMYYDDCELKAYDEKISIHFDWLSFTFPLPESNDITKVKKVSNILRTLCMKIGFEPDEVYPDKYPKNNYSNCFKIGQHIGFRYFGFFSKMNYLRELHDGSTRVESVETLQIEFTGQGCREIEERGKVDYNDLLRWFVVDLEGRARRVDIACDDTVGYLPITWIKNKIEISQDFTTRFRTPSGKVLPFSPSGSIDDGYSILFGSRNSTMMLLIYDKKKERAYREDPFMGDNWVRWELRFLGDKSQLAVDRYLDYSDNDMGNFYFENLTYMLQLKQKTFNNNPTDMLDKRKWDLDKRWQVFINNIRGVPLTMSKRNQTDIERKMAWRDYSLKRMHFQLDISESYDKKGEFFYSQIARFVHELEKEVDLIRDNKVKDSDLALINSSRIRRNPNSKPITKDDLGRYMIECIQLIDDLKKKYLYPF